MAAAPREITEKTLQYGRMKRQEGHQLSGMSDGSSEERDQWKDTSKRDPWHTSAGNSRHGKNETQNY